MSSDTPLIDAELEGRIRAFFPRYPTRRAVVLPALHAVQAALGYVPPQAVAEVAGLLELPAAEVQDTLSFYGFFKQDRPLGRFRVFACRSLSCAACGAEGLMDYLCGKLGIRPGQTTPDGRVTLETAECLGACDFAPAMLVNDTLYKNLTREKIDEWVTSMANSTAGRSDP